MKKKKSQEIHGWIRLVERFGLNKGDYNKLCKMIKTQNFEGTDSAKFVEKQSNARSVWDISYRGRNIRCIYDKERKNIITFLFQKG